MPPGADTVMVQEEARRDGDTVRLDGEGPGALGRNVRPKGLDFAADEVLLTEGLRLNPTRIALAAAAGAGGAARIAHIKGQPVRDVVCHELNEMEGTAVTDFFWCPIVGGNVFIYPTNVGERMGDNIRDWD